MTECRSIDTAVQWKDCHSHKYNGCTIIITAVKYSLLEWYNTNNITEQLNISNIPDSVKKNVNDQNGMIAVVITTSFD